ncbi:MAG: TonB-dependent receptor [Deltaproteobacteria bacterium]|nr:TonB-dependent receptor [Deltaproteobacteria bacterium]
MRPSIDSNVNRITGAIRYKPFRNLTLRTEYTKERRERERNHAEAWHLPDVTTRDIFTLSLYSRVLKKAKLSAKYVYQKTNQGNDNSVIHYEPQHSNQGILSLSWTPFPWMTALLNYNITKDKTDGLQIRDYYGAVVGSANDRERLKERLFGSVTFQLTEKLSLSPSYTYLYDEIEQDLVYDAWISGNLVDDGVKDKSKVQNYAVNVMYVPANNLSINAMLNYTKSSGEFHPGISEALNPGSVALFSEVRKEEITCELEGTYNFRNGWNVGLIYRYTDYDDESFDNPETGDCSSTMMMISKKW